MKKLVWKTFEKYFGSLPTSEDPHPKAATIERVGPDQMFLSIDDNEVKAFLVSCGGDPAAVEAQLRAPRDCGNSSFLPKIAILQFKNARRYQYGVAGLCLQSSDDGWWAYCLNSRRYAKMVDYLLEEILEEMSPALEGATVRPLQVYQELN